MALDPELHRQHAAQRQEIIVETVRTHAGAPIDEIIEVLRERMVARGLQPPPGRWLEAVARDEVLGVAERLDRTEAHDRDVVIRSFVHCAGPLARYFSRVIGVGFICGSRIATPAKGVASSNHV